MNNELKKKTMEWMQLERKTFEQRREADLYYETNLMRLIEEDFIERNKGVVNEQVRHLIISVGTSYEPIVLNMALLHPEKVLFLYTAVSETTLDKVVDHTGIKPSMYEKCMVNETDPIDIYREIKNAFLAWNRPKKMYIDFTGGTKAMSAAAALAGAMIDVRMLYVASDDYLVDFRKPRPGSERLVSIDNPLVVFGDLEVEKAVNLFEEHNFAGAKEKFSLVKESIPDPIIRQELNFYYILSCVYEAWDALDFGEASNRMEELVRQLKRDGRSFQENVLVKNGMIIDRQASFLSKLKDLQVFVHQKKQADILKNKEMIIPLMFTMYMNARTREYQRKYDMATLLFYRLLEMIEQRRLSNYGLYVSDMHYEEIVMPAGRLEEQIKQAGIVEWLKREVYGIKKQLFAGRVSDYLPNPVSLLDGFVILSALQDPIVYENDKTRVNLLKQMRSKVFLRNNSIFAHGLGPVSEGDYAKFRDFVISMFSRFCVIEKIKMKDYEEIFDWVSIHTTGVI